MASFVRSVLTEIYSALRVNHVALYGGSYDLSDVAGTHRVQWGEGASADAQIPGSAYVLIGGIKAIPDYDGATLGEYGVRTTLEWFGWVPTTDQTPESRALAAADLANDVIGALNRAHANSSGSFPVIHDLTEFLPTLDAVYGDGDDIPPGFGLAFGSIVYFQTLIRGV